MNQPRPHPPHGPHPMPSGPRTAAGFVVFALTMALIIATLLYPPIGVAAVATLVGAGRVRRSWPHASQQLRGLDTADAHGD